MARRTPPPIRSEALLQRAPAARILRHIQWELRGLLDRPGLTQEKLARAVSPPGATTNQSRVAKWLTSGRPIPLEVAKRLDAGIKIDGKPFPSHTWLGVGWTDLAEAHRAARSHAGRAAKIQPAACDVFLASPMASIEDAEYEAQRRTALDVKKALETYCSFSVYYAGTGLSSSREFEAADAATETNFRALAEASYFVLLLTAPVARPSSVFVEAGWALANWTPSLYLVPDLSVLPYCLRELHEHLAPDLLPPVRWHRTTDMDTATDLIRNQGEVIFQRLDAAMDAQSR